MRLLHLTKQHRLVRVLRERKHRGDVYVVFDRHHRLLLFGQSVPKIATAINAIFPDAEDHVSYQGLYQLLLGKMVGNHHKGWSIIRLRLEQVPSFWEEVRTQEHYLKTGYVCENANAYVVSTIA